MTRRLLGFGFVAFVFGANVVYAMRETPNSELLACTSGCVCEDGVACTGACYCVANVYCYMFGTRDGNCNAEVIEGE